MSQDNITDENNKTILKKKSLKVLEPKDKLIKVKNKNTFLTFYRENNSKKVKK
jgi:hypothetical protein